jgi:hypothetical protein
MSSRCISFNCPREGCEGTFEDVECEVEPGDPNYGADADGNRGIYLPASLNAPSYDGEECSEGHTMDTPEEVREWEARAEREVRDYRVEPDEPDYDPDEYDYDPWEGY